MDEELYKENILDHYRNPHDIDALVEAINKAQEVFKR